MNPARDHTPIFTKVFLIVVLIINGTVLYLANSDSLNPVTDNHFSLALWLLTALFIARVGGQIIVALHPRSWLPPMEQWNLIPYHILLPIQIVIIVIMLWINVNLSLNLGIAHWKGDHFGKFLIFFSLCYAIGMAIRYVLRMRRKPDQRWFGGTIPIVFHFVLALYLYVIGRFYAVD